MNNPTPAASGAATGEAASILRFNPVPGLGMNPHPTGIYVYYKDHLAAIKTAQPASPSLLTKALRDATSALVGAASAYRTFAKRHASQGKAETDSFFSTRVSNMDKAVERARAALASPQVAPAPESPLTSAAPDLLAALQVVVADWTAQFERNGHLAPAWCKQARAAIAKATGEEA